MRISDWSSDVCSSDLHTLRVHDLAICYIVSDRKQRPNEYLITLLPFGEPGIAVHAGLGQQSAQEAAFGPGWNDDGVLHALRLHPSQYLGTAIVTPVGPAPTTPRHFSGPPVTPRATRVIKPDFRSEATRAGRERGLRWQNRLYAET